MYVLAMSFLRRAIFLVEFRQILLSIFINARASSLFDFYLFADDLKLLSNSSSINFQSDIHNVYQWSVENGRICNTPHEYTLNSLVIERVPSIKDLGPNT